jgi:hypothetical protein
MTKKEFLESCELSTLRDIIYEFFTNDEWRYFALCGDKETRPYNEVLREWLITTIDECVSRYDLINNGWATEDLLD